MKWAGRKRRLGGRGEEGDREGAEGGSGSGSGKEREGEKSTRPRTREHAHPLRAAHSLHHFSKLL